jgi:nitrate/TMAO reductase-like tetraheme cytochrome c subunit
LTLPDRPDEWDIAPAEPDPEPGPVSYGRFSRFDRLRGLVESAGRFVRPPRTARGFVVALLVVGGLGSLTAAGGLLSQKWTETEAFCSKCHTMKPEAKAYERSIHRDVACGECHVGPGIGGLVKAKLNGAKQTLEILAGTYPEPVPEPDHAKLPSPKDTCMKCHSLDVIAAAGKPTGLVLKPRFREDKGNTRETVAVVVRPSGLGGKHSTGAHWHVLQNVEFATPDETSQKIDWVKVTYKDGSTKEFITRKKVNVSSDVQPDVERIKRSEATRPMDCITCHNRVGHEIPTPGQALDESLAAGKISPSLPYIKREAVARLSKDYGSEGEADKALEGIRGWYEGKYPLVARTRRRQVDRAVDELKLLYPLVATPEMKSVAADYPNNLGHEDGPGCFRCHDGAHYEVGPNGRLLDKVIPWECTTCHTFPQVGKTVSSVSLLGEPPDHESKLWVFNHKYSAERLEPNTSSSFCSNCHDSGAAKVNHDEMLYRHPEAIAKAGIQACAYCHQETFCARCHKKRVLDVDKPYVHSKADLLHAGRE